MSLEGFFNPKSIAIIGASRTPEKLGYIILENLKFSFKGKIYPINPNATEILGLSAYPSVLEIEEPIDLAIIVVPAEIVKKVSEECIKKKIKSIIIISSGFSEIGEKGRELELKNLLKGKNVRIMGPNCLSGDTSILITNDNHIKYTEIGSLIDYYIEKNNNKVLKDCSTYILPTNLIDKDIKVLSWDGKDFKFKKVKNFFKREGEALKIIIEGGRELIASPDHPFLIKTPFGIKEILCRYLEVGQEIPIMFNFNEERNIEEINLLEEFDKKLPEDILKEIRFKWDTTYDFNKFAELCLNDSNLKKTRITTKHSMVTLPTILPITNELCELIGFFIADGNYDKDWLSIGYTESKEENEEIRRCINEVFTCDICTSAKEGKIKFGRKIGRILFNDIFEIGKYSENKSIPNFIYQASPEKVIAFLSGLYAGDGGICYEKKKKRFTFYISSISKKLIQQTVYLLSRIGVGPFYITRKKRTESWFKGKKYGARDSYTLTTNSDQAIRKLVELGFRFIDSKQNEILLSVLNKKKFKPRINGTIYFRKIKKIERLEGKHNLYDLEVEGTHTFVANQIVTHNCIGIYKKDLDMIFLPRNRLKRPPDGSISFITQSGAFGSILLDIMSNDGVGVSKFISVGNKIDVDEIELIKYLEDDLATRCIAIYLESVKNGEEFIKIAKRVTKKKPIVCFKAGKTQKGSEAVLSHTGALAGSAEIYSAAFKQAGIIEAKTSEEIFDFAKALANQPALKSNKIAIVTDGGGFGVVATDAAINYGLELPPLTDESVKALKGFLPKYAVTKNPIDLTGDATVERYKNTLDIVLKDKNISGIVCIALMQIPTLTDEIVDVIRDAKVFGKPITVCSAGGQYVLERNRKLESFGIPVYPTPERAVKALAILHEYENILKREEVVKKK